MASLFHRVVDDLLAHTIDEDSGRETDDTAGTA
jgi:hypothetical protein